jgi:putative hydrolase of the HAD superfamily
MLKALFFDLDGTLADDGDSIADALARACAVVCRRWPELEVSELAILYRQVSDATWDDYDQNLRHLGSPEAMLASIWDKTLARWGLHDPTGVQETVATYWQHRLLNCRVYPDVLPVLQGLAGQFQLSVLTNGAPAMQRAKFAATGLTPFFRHVFVGGEFHRGKPDPAIFRAALEAAGCRPDQAVHIGDSLVHDIAGAHRVGIHSVWLNRKGLAGESHTSDFEIASLLDLSRCLERLSIEV